MKMRIFKRGGLLLVCILVCRGKKGGKGERNKGGGVATTFFSPSYSTHTHTKNTHAAHLFTDTPKKEKEATHTHFIHTHDHTFEDNGIHELSEEKKRVRGLGGKKLPISQESKL
jgi:hypothetical protein